MRMGGTNILIANPRDLIGASRPNSLTYHDEEPALLTEIGVDPAKAAGEWIGLMHVSARGADLVRAELAAMEQDGSLAGADMLALIERLARRHPVAVHYITGHWLDVDTPADLAEARNFS